MVFNMNSPAYLLALATAPFTFTEIMKPIIQHLRKIGLQSVLWLNDFLLISDTYKGCLRNFNITWDLLIKLGFIINAGNCQSDPSQMCTFLGFVFHSVFMTLTIMDKRKLLYDKEITIWI